MTDKIASLLLSGEDETAYRQTLQEVLALFEPLDTVKRNLIEYFVYDSIVIDRAQRHSALAIERRYQETLAYRLQKAKARKIRDEERARAKLVEAGSKPEDIARLMALEENVQSASEDVMKIFQDSDAERLNNTAFQDSIEFIERLDEMVQRAHRRRQDMLHLLEFYETGLALRANAATEEALKANRTRRAKAEEGLNGHTEADDSPSIVPTIGTHNNDLGPENPN
jgi:hypothetical protein